MRILEADIYHTEGMHIEKQSSHWYPDCVSLLTGHPSSHGMIGTLRTGFVWVTQKIETQEQWQHKWTRWSNGREHGVGTDGGITNLKNARESEEREREGDRKRGSKFIPV